jgi:hypothetical protein
MIMISACEVVALSVWWPVHVEWWRCEGCQAFRETRGGPSTFFGGPSKRQIQLT